MPPAEITLRQEPVAPVRQEIQLMGRRYGVLREPSNSIRLGKMRRFPPGLKQLPST
jgi:hypothetical protein